MDGNAANHYLPIYDAVSQNVNCIHEEVASAIQARVVNPMYPEILERVHARRTQQQANNGVQPIYNHVNAATTMADQTVAVPPPLCAHAQFMTLPTSVSMRLFSSAIASDISRVMIALKNDGIRCWLLLFQSQEEDGIANVALLVNRAGRMWQLADLEAPTEMFRGTLIDGELMPSFYNVETGQCKSEFVAFDVVEFCATRWIPTTTWAARQTVLHHIRPLVISSQITLVVKEWRRLTAVISECATFQHFEASMQQQQRSCGIENGASDGYILQLDSVMPYKPVRSVIHRHVDCGVFKIKSVHTIDIWMQLVFHEDAPSPSMCVFTDDDQAKYMCVNDNILWKSRNICMRAMDGMDNLMSDIFGAAAITGILRGTLDTTPIIVELAIYADPHHGRNDVYARLAAIRTDKSIANSTSTVVATICGNGKFSAEYMYNTIKRML